MLIQLRDIRHNAAAIVMAAADVTEIQGNERVAFYLLAVLYSIKYAKTAAVKSAIMSIHKRLPPKSQREVSPVMKALKAGIVPDLSLDLSNLNPTQARMARAVARIAGDPKGQVSKLAEVCRAAGSLNVPEVNKSVRVDPDSVYEGDKLRGKERIKADNRYFKDTVINMVRDGESTEAILAELDSDSGTKAFSRSIPKQFRKDITLDETGALKYKGEPLVSRALSPITIWVLKTSKVVMPTRQLGEHGYMFGYIPAVSAGGVQKVYKLSSVRKANEKKWSAVDKFSKMLPKLQAKWTGLMRKGDGMGMLLQFAYLTSARIGNPGSSAQGKDGITTLRMQNATVKGPLITIEYSGKGKGAGVAQKHILRKSPETALLMKYITERKAKVAATAPLFSQDGVDGVDPITAAEANAWLKSATGGVVTVHKFRHVRGTQVATEALAKLKIPPKVTQAEANRLFKSAMESVGTVLGHFTLKGDEAHVTAMTAIKNYISPEIGIEWFKGLGLVPPTQLFPALKYED